MVNINYLDYSGLVKYNSSVKEYIRENYCTMCDNINDLKSKASTMKYGEIYKTLGFYNIGDNGAATYIIVNNDLPNNILPTAANGDIYINSQFKASLMVEDGKITPEQFGAYCNSVNSDTQSLHNALNTAIANNLKLELKHNGVYVSNGAITGILLKLDGNLVDIEGNGATIFANNANGLMIQYGLGAGTVTGEYINAGVQVKIKIRNLSIVGNFSGASYVGLGIGGTDIQFNQLYDYNLIENVSVRGFNSNLSLINFRKCNFKGCSFGGYYPEGYRNGFAAVFQAKAVNTTFNNGYGFCGDFVFEGCEFVMGSNDGSAISTYAASSADKAECRGLHFSHCAFYGNNNTTGTLINITNDNVRKNDWFFDGCQFDNHIKGKVFHLYGSGSETGMCENITINDGYNIGGTTFLVADGVRKLFVQNNTIKTASGKEERFFILNNCKNVEISNNIYEMSQSFSGLSEAQQKEKYNVTTNTISSCHRMEITNNIFLLPSGSGQYEAFQYNWILFTTDDNRFITIRNNTFHDMANPIARLDGGNGRTPFSSDKYIAIYDNNYSSSWKGSHYTNYQNQEDLTYVPYVSGGNADITPSVVTGYGLYATPINTLTQGNYAFVQPTINVYKSGKTIIISYIINRSQGDSIHNLEFLIGEGFPSPIHNVRNSFCVNDNQGSVYIDANTGTLRMNVIEANSGGFTSSGQLVYFVN